MLFMYDNLSDRLLSYCLTALVHFDSAFIVVLTLKKAVERFVAWTK